MATFGPAMFSTIKYASAGSLCFLRLAYISLPGYLALPGPVKLSGGSNWQSPVQRPSALDTHFGVTCHEIPKKPKSVHVDGIATISNSPVNGVEPLRKRRADHPRKYRKAAKEWQRKGIDEYPPYLCIRSFSSNIKNRFTLLRRKIPVT